MAKSILGERGLSNVSVNDVLPVATFSVGQKTRGSGRRSKTQLCYPSCSPPVRKPGVPRARHRRVSTTPTSAAQSARGRFPSASELARLATAGGDIAHVWHCIDRRFQDPPDVPALFNTATVHTHGWTATYDRDSYLQLLGTHSSYLMLDGGQRTRLSENIGALID
jgi:hypothetical protein